MTNLAAPLDVHLIAIGGTGMAPIACLLKEAGHRVRGSDGPLYPPMSTLLGDAGIEPLLGYDAAHLDPPPDLVVVGNAVPRSNPEAARAEQLGIERLSMPEALARFFLAGRAPLVVAGTHGKTTTTSLAAWVYSSAGADPGYLVGGVPIGLGRSFARGSGRRFIVEGDEYNAAYFDRGPKFLHYQPQALILTSVEYDHADLYASPESLRAAYRDLVSLLPADGLLVACGDSPGVREIAALAACTTLTDGLGADNDIGVDGAVRHTAEGSRFLVRDPRCETVEVALPLAGDHNVANALAVWAVARHDGLAPREVARALASFRGVRRRMEELGSAGGVTVVDDFAHHPTALAVTARAIGERYPGRRRVVVFEPRSLTAGRSFLFDAYVEAGREADVLLFAPLFHRDRLEAAERLDRQGLARALRRLGVDARVGPSVDALLAELLDLVEPGDVVVTMSSGDFGGLPHRLLEALSRRAAGAHPGATRHSTGG